MRKLGKIHLSWMSITAARRFPAACALTPMKSSTVLKFLFLVIILLLFCHWPSREQGPGIGALMSDKEGQRLKKIVDKALDKFVSDRLSILSISTSNSFVSPGNLDRIIRVQSYLACLVHNAKWDREVTVNGPELSLVLPKHCKFSSSQYLLAFF